MTDRDRLVEVIQGFVVLLKDLEMNAEVTKDGKLRIRKFYEHELKRETEMYKDTISG